MLKFKDIFEKSKEMSNKEYDLYFQKLLKKYKIKDISELSDKDKSKFFKEIDRAVKSDTGS